MKNTAKVSLIVPKGCFSQEWTISIGTAIHQKLVEEKVSNKESQPASLNVETSKRDDFAENKAVFRIYEAPPFNLS